jgi:glutaredoxin
MIKTRTLIMKTIHTIFIVGLLICLLPNAANAAKLYKWIADDGSVSYRDSPPPENTSITHKLMGDTTTPEADVKVVEESTIPAVVVYTIEACGACTQLIERLSELGIEAEEKSLLDREVQAKILQETDSLIAPTLFIGDKIISMGAEVDLKAELIESGYDFPDETAADDPFESFFDNYGDNSADSSTDN